MVLMICLGLFMTIFGVAFGCSVLELTLRALGHILTEHPEPVVQPEVGSRLLVTGR